MLALPWGAPADKAERLEQIRAEIEAREARAREYREQAEGQLQELEGIDRQLSELRRSVARLRQREAAAEKELDAARVGQEEAERQLARIRGELEARLVTLYKFSAAGGVPALFSAGDFQSFARRRHGLSRILERDRALFARHREARETWRGHRAEAEALVAELAGARRELGSRQGAVRALVVERRNAAALLRSRSDRELKVAEELRAAAARLEEALSRLPAAVAPFAGAGLPRGQLIWPVEGSVRQRFGRQVDVEFGTETLRTGVEIDAPAGTPVRAVAEGQVLFAGWFRGFGQMVILDHGKGAVSVSGYLRELYTQAGERVGRGQALGSVGQTGSLAGPGLYFEIRHKGKPVDPVGWLRRR